MFGRGEVEAVILFLLKPVIPCMAGFVVSSVFIHKQTNFF